MSTIVTRAAKGSALTHNEVDANFVNLNTDKLQSGDTAAALTITSATINGGTITGTALNGTLGATTPSTAVVTSLTDSGLTSGRVTFASTGGLLADSANLTFDGTTLSTVGLTTTGNTILGNASTDTLNVGNGDLIKDASGNVGIGTTSPTQKLDVVASGVATAIRVATTSSHAAFLEASSNTATVRTRLQANLTDAFTGTLSNHDFFFQTNGLERMRITSGGEVLIGTTTVTSGGANLQVSDGITFPATAVASANANTLDDYEEGTWTPTIVGATTAGTGTYIQQVGTYTKVGRLVTITGVITWTAHTGTGGMRVSGLPFTSINIASAEYYGSTSFVNMTMPASTVPLMAIGPNVANINVQSQTVGSGASTLLTMDTAASMYFSLTYQAA